MCFLPSACLRLTSRPKTCSGVLSSSRSRSSMTLLTRLVNGIALPREPLSRTSLERSLNVSSFFETGFHKSEKKYLMLYNFSIWLRESIRWIGFYAFEIRLDLSLKHDNGCKIAIIQFGRERSRIRTRVDCSVEID